MRYFLSTCLILLSIATFAQGSWQDNIKWKFSLEKIDSCHAYIVGKATLLNHFHIFSVNHDPKKADFTGTPTTFDIKANKNFKLVGKLKDGSASKKFVDELGEQLYFEGTATFKQQIEILSNEAIRQRFYWGSYLKSHACFLELHVLVFSESNEQVEDPPLYHQYLHST